MGRYGKGKRDGEGQGRRSDGGREWEVRRNEGKRMGRGEDGERGWGVERYWKGLGSGERWR